MNAVDLANLNQRAAKVREMDDRMMSAFDEEHLAGAALLTAVIEAVAPCLEAIASRVRIDDRTDMADRGVWLAGAKTEPKNDGDGAYLMDDGRLLRVEVKSVGEDAFAVWFYPMTAAEFEERWDVEATVGYLSNVVDQQLSGSRSRRTAQAESHARKLRAVAELLGPRK